MPAQPLGKCTTLLCLPTMSLGFFTSKMGSAFFLEVLRGTLQLICKMMNMGYPLKDLALRKGSINAIIII